MRDSSRELKGSILLAAHCFQATGGSCNAKNFKVDFHMYCNIHHILTKKFVMAASSMRTNVRDHTIVALVQTNIWLRGFGTTTSGL